MAETTPVRIENDTVEKLRDVAYRLTGSTRTRVTLTDAVKALIDVAENHWPELHIAAGGTAPETTEGTK